VKRPDKISVIDDEIRVFSIIVYQDVGLNGIPEIIDGDLTINIS